VYYPIEPTADAGEVSGYVPADAIRAAAQNKPFCGLILHREKETTVPCKGTFPNPYAKDTVPPKFPDWETIVAYPKQNYHHITFNAQYLADIAAVLSPGTSIVTVHYNPDAPRDALHVTTEQGQSIAMLMPCRGKK